MHLWLKTNARQVNDEKLATHYYNPTKTYYDIPLECNQDFWINYCDSINKGCNPNLSEYLGNQKAVQLGYDIKIIFENQQVSKNPQNIIDLVKSIDSYIITINGIIQNMMTYHFKRTDAGSEYITCYLRRGIERVLIWDENRVTFNGKLIFPYARIGTEYILLFYHLVVNQIQIQFEGMSNLTIPPLNGLDTLIQPMNNEVRELYGSSLKDDIEPLQLYAIYGYVLTDVLKQYNIKEVLIPGLHRDVLDQRLSEEVLQSKTADYTLKYWLPLFLSTGFHYVPLEFLGSTSNMSWEMPKVNMTTIREGGEELTLLEKTKKLLGFISHKRADRYWSWIDIGQALYTVDQGREGLTMWKSFTTQSDFHDEADCDELWYTFSENNSVNIETLEYFAFKDNPGSYNAYRETEIREAINAAIQLPEDVPIARAFKACFPHEFICANHDKSEWYYYEQNRWVNVDGNSMLMVYINDKFQPKIEAVRADISQKVVESRDRNFKSRHENTLTLIADLIRKLNRTGAKESLCRELRVHYRCPKFYKMKDMNRSYMATPSGVIDVRGGKAIVRPGKPQDYITRTTRFAYPHDFTWNTPVVRNVVKYIRQVFRITALREYFWRFATSLLYGGNNDKIFPIFSGQGNNSKSILVRLFEAAFGSYAVKLPTALITEKRTGADVATPSLIYANGAKVAFLQEPNKNDIIQSGTVKELSGNDTMYGRDLFQKGSQIIEIDVTFVPILITNKIPMIPDCQQAIWERTRVLEFLSVWAKNASENEDEQFEKGIFKLNRFFDRDIPIMAPAFLWLLVHKYGEYNDRGLDDPAEVLQATENFRVQNNFYIHFTRDNIKPVLDKEGNPDNNAFVTLDEAFNCFRRWYGDQMYRLKVPNKTEFKENIEIVWKSKGSPENKWFGIQLNTPAATLQDLLSV